jgi:hypothetical protein
MDSEKASETLDYISILTRLVAWEDFIAFSRSESFKSYTLRWIITDISISLASKKDS